MRRMFRAGAAALAVFTAAASVALLASPYLRRWTFLMYADVHDYDRLPARTVPRSQAPFRFPTDLEPDWVAPLNVQVGGERLGSEADLGRFLAAHATTAFIAVKDGRLIDERYFNGAARDSWFKSFSVSKSALSALYGIALADGVIASLDDPVTAYLPDMRDAGFRQVTLRHCLDATAGIHYTRGPMPWHGQPRMYYTTDARAHVRLATLDSAAGTGFSPDDLAPLILGAALERALRRRDPHLTLSGYFAARLWQPLGAEYDACWNLDHEGDGLEKTESGLTLRAIDLAKLGVLFANGGRWRDAQLLPAEWVAASGGRLLPERVPNKWPGGFHSLQWWGRTAGAAAPDFYANGHFGQRLYVSPRANLVLLRMGEDNAGVDWADALGRLADAVAATEPYPEPLE